MTEALPQQVFEQLGGPEQMFYADCLRIIGAELGDLHRKLVGEVVSGLMAEQDT